MTCNSLSYNSIKKVTSVIFEIVLFIDSCIRRVVYSTNNIKKHVTADMASMVNSTTYLIWTALRVNIDVALSVGSSSVVTDIREDKFVVGLIEPRFLQQLKP